MSDQSFGFSRCHQLTLPFAYDSSYPNFLAKSSSLGFSVSKSNLSNTASVSWVSRCCRMRRSILMFEKREKRNEISVFQSHFELDEGSWKGQKNKKVCEYFSPECMSSNSMARLDSNLIPKIPILPRIMAHTHLLGNVIFPSYWLLSTFSCRQREKAQQRHIQEKREREKAGKSSFVEDDDASERGRHKERSERNCGNHFGMKKMPLVDNLYSKG